MWKKSKNDNFSYFFKSDLRSAFILTDCGIAGGKDKSRTREIARKILIFPQAHLWNKIIGEKYYDSKSMGLW
jgi:hypothetical protein